MTESRLEMLAVLVVLGVLVWAWWTPTMTANLAMTANLIELLRKGIQ
jgi:uncharacterized ion transporter superfamily protein YfcC